MLDFLQIITSTLSFQGPSLTGAVVEVPDLVVKLMPYLKTLKVTQSKHMQDFNKKLGDNETFLLEEFKLQ